MSNQRLDAVVAETAKYLKYIDVAELRDALDWRDGPCELFVFCEVWDRETVTQTFSMAIGDRNEDQSIENLVVDDMKNVFHCAGLLTTADRDDKYALACGALVTMYVEHKNDPPLDGCENVYERCFIMLEHAYPKIAAILARITINTLGRVDVQHLAIPPYLGDE